MKEINNKILRRLKNSFWLCFIPHPGNNFRPRFLENNFLIWCVVFLFISKLLVAAVLYMPKTTFLSNLTAIVAKDSLIALTNNERTAAGISQLKISPQLEEAAYLKAYDMMTKGYFSHQSPSGKKPWDWIRGANYNYKYAGENLAIGFLDSSEVIQAWNSSPSHRANLLNPNFQEIGIAVVKGNFQGGEAILVVQFFGSPLKSKAPTSQVARNQGVKIPQTGTSITPQSENTSESINEALPQEAAGVDTQGKSAETQIPENKEIPSEIISQATGKNNTPLVYALRFLAGGYTDIIQKITFILLILVIISLMLNIFIRIDVQDPGLIFRSTILIIFIVSLAILNKDFIIRLIPHNLII